MCGPSCPPWAAGLVEGVTERPSLAPEACVDLARAFDSVYVAPAKAFDPSGWVGCEVGVVGDGWEGPGVYSQVATGGATGGGFDAGV